MGLTGKNRVTTEGGKRRLYAGGSSGIRQKTKDTVNTSTEKGKEKGGEGTLKKKKKKGANEGRCMNAGYRMRLVRGSDKKDERKHKKIGEGGGKRRPNYAKCRQKKATLYTKETIERKKPPKG